MVRAVHLALSAARSLAWVAALLVLAVRLASAQAVAAGGTTPVELTVVGGPTLNLNAQGRPSPVVVRIFDLGAAAAFEAADYTALFEHPGDALKTDLLAQEEFVLRPGDIQQHNRDLQPGVQVLGVAAAFRDMPHAVWHLTVPLTPGRRNFLLVDLDRNTIRLMPVDQGQP
jgi:type VI secretion system protein VasD